MLSRLDSWRAPQGIIPDKSSWQNTSMIKYQRHGKSLKTMKRPLLFALIGVGVVGLVFLALPAINLAPQRIPALVTSKHYHPNQAENGYIGATVRSLNGQKYEINATGFLNVPSGFYPSMSCLPNLHVHTGDVVIFNLPADKYQENTLTTCYENSESGYFIKVIPITIIGAVAGLVAAIFVGRHVLRRSRARRA